MKMYKVKEGEKVETFFEITDALNHMFERVQNEAEKLELYSYSVGCKYTLLYTFTKGAKKWDFSEN